MVNIVQLVRMSDCGSEGREFEPHYSPYKVSYRVPFKSVGLVQKDRHVWLILHISRFESGAWPLLCETLYLANVVELVDTTDLSSVGVIHESSSLSIRTIYHIGSSYN